MSESFRNNNGDLEEVKSNVLLGTIGAILGALVGAAIWVLVYQLGYVAWIAGVAIIYCSYKGYTLLSKRKDWKAGLISIIVSILVLCVAHYGCWGYEIYKQFSEVYEITLMEAMRSVPSIVFSSDVIETDSSILIGFCRDFLIGFVLIFVGYFCYIRKDIKNAGETEAE